MKRNETILIWKEVIISRSEIVKRKDLINTKICFIKTQLKFVLL